MVSILIYQNTAVVKKDVCFSLQILRRNLYSLLFLTEFENYKKITFY